jgi:acetoacetyl-CoA synthetase
MNNMEAHHPILWQPTEATRTTTNLHDYLQWLEQEKQLTFDDMDALWQWSVDHPEDFWESIAIHLKVIFHAPYREVMSTTGMPGTKWFNGSTLNYAEHVFRHAIKDRPALYFASELNTGTAISWEALSRKTSQVQQYLRSIGVQVGDRVVGYLPNTPDTLAIFYAVNSLGAIWSCCSPDFGASTVTDRFAQIQPKVLFATDAYVYNGKKVLRDAEVDAIRQSLATLEDTVIVPYPDLDKGSATWQAIESLPAEPLTFTAVPFEHPIWVLYSSGTTGKPKAITHSHGGVLLEHLKYLYLHNDVKAGENFFWFTTTGWMMWNFLQGSLLLGATAVLFDGSPGYPDLSTLWKLAGSLPIHHFGTSAPYLTACMKRELQPGKEFDLQALRSIGSTGAPLPPEAFDWVYDAIHSDIWLCSMSGGTDVCTAFVGGHPYLPVRKGLIQTRALGCDLHAFDEAGQPIFGSLGEMVIKTPMPSMPIYFWNDPDHVRYKESYFHQFEGYWCHGDWIKLFEGGSLIIQGRSDATLNRKGIRIGTAEIYAVLNKIEGIKDSLIINLEKENGEDLMPLFVVPEAGADLNTLTQTIQQQLRTQCTPRHVPDRVIPVADIPYTLSGKKMEVPVKKLLMGISDPAAMNKDAIRNPAAMDAFADLKDTL